MGISSDGQLCYGIAFEEDYNFPWLDEEWDSDYEEWWFSGICGYKPPFELYDERGKFIKGERPPQEKMDEYYEDIGKFRKLNPMPVEIIGFCSYDYTMYIIAAPETYTNVRRGYVEEVGTYKVEPEKKNAVISFCEKYCKTEDEYDNFPEMKPCWLLSSMYG